MFDEQRDVIRAVSKSRQMDGDHAQPVIQVLADGSRLERLLDRLIRRGDDAHIDRKLSRIPEMANAALLKDTHQFHLKVGGHFHHFIQKDRAPVGCAKQTFRVADRAGESAFLITKQFAFNQIFRQRATIDSNEGSIGFV